MTQDESKQLEQPSGTAHTPKWEYLRGIPCRIYRTKEDFDLDKPIITLHNSPDFYKLLNLIINAPQTARKLAIALEPIKVYVRGGVAECDDPRVEIIDYDNEEAGEATQ